MDAPPDDYPAQPAGLTQAEALKRLETFGPNAVRDRPPSPLRSFLSKFWAPIPWLLEGAIVLQIGLGERV